MRTRLLLLGASTRHFLVSRTPFFPASFKGQCLLYFTVLCQKSFESFNLNNSRAKSMFRLHPATQTSKHKLILRFSPRTIQATTFPIALWKPETCPISLPCTLYIGVVTLIPVWKVRCAFAWHFCKLHPQFCGTVFWYFSHYSPKIKEKHCYWIHTTSELISITDCEIVSLDRKIEILIRNVFIPHHWNIEFIKIATIAMPRHPTVCRCFVNFSELVLK